MGVVSIVGVTVAGGVPVPLYVGTGAGVNVSAGVVDGYGVMRQSPQINDQYADGVTVPQPLIMPSSGHDSNVGYARGVGVLMSINGTLVMVGVGVVGGGVVVWAWTIDAGISKTGKKKRKRIFLFTIY